MKRPLLLAAAMLLSIFSFQLNAQVNRGFSFQGYARKADGSAVSNKTVQVRFSIATNGSSDPDFDETHTVETDPFGIFIADIGTVNKTTFDALNFELYDYFLKVEVALPGSDFVVISNKQLKSVPYAEAAGNGVPSGSIIPFAGSADKVPKGYVVCDGKVYDQNDPKYASLYAAIGRNWGGEGNNFRVPDLRGYFLRGWSDDTDNDPEKADRIELYAGGNTGNRIGSFQTDATKLPNNIFQTKNDGSHKHTIQRNNVFESFGGSGSKGFDIDNNSSGGKHQTNSESAYQINNGGAHRHDIEGGDLETRPKNVTVLYIIKL